MDPRKFEVVSEVTGDRYRVEFRWMQTAISLRHSDTIDVKFVVNNTGKVVALPHAALQAACTCACLRLTDDLCLRTAARHLHDALLTGVDAEQDLLTVTPERVDELVTAEGRNGTARASP